MPRLQAASPLGRSVRSLGSPLRVAIVGNYPPRQCGIATFTRDVAQGLSTLGCSLAVIAMDDALGTRTYPPVVKRVVDPQSREAHGAAGTVLRDWAPDVVLVEHEFGIFGGASGAWLLDMLARVDAPVVATLHTVLEDPTPEQARVMRELVERADAFIVMADGGAAILEQQGIDGARVHVLPHGAPDRPFERPTDARTRIGWDDVPTLLTFGLLSPGKGIEHVIDALPRILETMPNARYTLLGATHPHLLAQEGERYRDGLVERAEALGVAHALTMIPRYVDEDELCDALAAADVYITPYANPAQITSGTLAFALGLGKPVVSTPYAHAREVLPPEQLVPHGDAEALGERVASLLADPARLEDLSRRTWRRARDTAWPVVAARTLDVLRSTVHRGATSVAAE